MPSLMNGLSALGAGVAAFAGTAGLEQQKSDLADQQAVLADKLATARETGLQQSAGAIAATAAQKQQDFQSGQTDKELAARATEGAATRASEMARTQMQINAPPDVVKLLRAVGVQLPGDTPAATGAPSSASGIAPGPPVSGTAATASAAGPSGVSAPSSGAAGASSASVPPAVSPMDIPIVRNAMGLPATGSEAATRMAIANDVASDPTFKYKTAGQKAAEVEGRVAVAEGKMTDPSSRSDMAKAIASYQIAPLASFALTKPGGPETMAEVMRLNPDYQEARYPEVSKAMAAFGSGPQSNIIRSINVGVQHLDVLDQAGQALANGDVKVLNSLKNQFQQQFGAPEPTTFEGIKQIVGTEVEKAVAGGIGASSDRDRLMAALDRANSPAQLQAITDGFRSLMIGQLSGLKTQYEDSTGFKAGPFAFENKLVPATVKGLNGGASAATSSATSSTAPDPIAMARDAIAKGAPAAAVIKRLQDNGINAGALMGQPGDMAGPGRD